MRAKQISQKEKKEIRGGISLARPMKAARISMNGYDKNGGPFSGVDIEKLIMGPRKKLFAVCKKLIEEKLITTRNEFARFAPKEVVKEFRKDTALWDGVELSKHAKNGKKSKSKDSGEEVLVPLPHEALELLQEDEILGKVLPPVIGEDEEVPEEDDEELMYKAIPRRNSSPPEPACLDKRWRNANEWEKKTIASKLFKLAVSGTAAEVAQMLNRGAPLDVKDGVGRPFFIFVAERGREDLMDVLIERMCSLDKRDKNGDTMLMVASEFGRIKAVRRLLGVKGKKKPDVNAVNKQGMSALMLASNEGHADVVDGLLGAGAKPNMRDRYGFTALQYAKEEGHEEVVALFRARRK